jgi:signal transduction histidine kinase/CheY-like chemotaxis protein/GAF domain-containing protein
MDSERILVIDDDPQVLAFIRRLLARSGYQVETVSRGDEALERLRLEATLEDGNLALVLSDLKMPEVDGLQILEHVKDYCPDAVFVLMTGYATTDSAVVALRQGVYDYLTKPLDLDDLVSTVQRALEHRALVMQNKRLIEFLREKNVVLEFLHREEQRKSEQLRQVNSIARQITPILDVEQLVKTVLSLVGPTFEFLAPSFGLIKGDQLVFHGGQLDGQGMPVTQNVYWELTDGGRRPAVRLRPGSTTSGRAEQTSWEGTAAHVDAPFDLIFPLNKATTKGVETVGLLVADWAEDAVFREENLGFLEALAAQTVVVLENARLYALAQQVDELAFLNQVGRAANESLHLQERVRAVLECVQDAFHPSVVELSLLNLSCPGHSKIDRRYGLVEGAFASLDRSHLGEDLYAAVIERSLVVQEQSRTRDTQLLCRSVLGVRLDIRERPIGVLCMGSSEPGAFSLEHGRAMRIAAGQVATAIQNARLFQEVESARGVILESRNTLRTLVDGILEGIFIVDRDRVIRAINRTQAELAGRAFSDLVGHPVELAFPSSQQSLDLIEQTFRTGQPTSCTERHPLEGEEAGSVQLWGATPGWTEWEIDTYPVHIAAEPAVGSVPAGDPREKGESLVDRVIVVVRDVTEQRLLETSLVQAEKMAAIGTLAAGFAHEINNPMTVISANAQILEQELLDEHPYYESVEMINRAARRASRVVRKLLDVSRYEEFELAPTDLNLSLTEAINLVETQLRKSNVEILCELDPDLPPIWASLDYLHVVWLNLLLNARDAIEEKGRAGTIRVSSSLKDGQVVVRIADSGVGMAEEMLKHLYEPFFTTKGPGKGTGLGLFTCYRTLVRHGGDIQVESQEGEGSVFRVTLPVYAAPVCEV